MDTCWQQSTVNGIEVILLTPMGKIRILFCFYIRGLIICHFPIYTSHEYLSLPIMATEVTMTTWDWQVRYMPYPSASNHNTAASYIIRDQFSASISVICCPLQHSIIPYAVPFWLDCRRGAAPLFAGWDSLSHCGGGEVNLIIPCITCPLTIREN